MRAQTFAFVLIVIDAVCLLAVLLRRAQDREVEVQQEVEEWQQVRIIWDSADDEEYCNICMGSCGRQ